MKSKNKIFLIFLTIFNLIFTACSPMLTSANYWSGAKREKSWVSKHCDSVKIKEEVETSDQKFLEPVKAFKKKNGEKFKIGIVVSGGDYWEFFENLKGLILGFSNIGWAKNIIIPNNISKTTELITWINTVKYSDYIEFDIDYFVDLAWGDNLDELHKKYFENKPDVDAVIAYGGMAAKEFYNVDNYSIPVLSDAITDSFGLGITKTAIDSGKPFFTGKIDLESFKQQIRLFHKAVGFKSLGIVYGDDEYGRIYGAVRDIEEIANELGFKIIRNTNVREYMSDETVPMYLEALKDVASKADAVYIGASTAVTEYDITKDIVKILNKAQKPSFSLEGSIRVKDGILYSFSASGFTRAGNWVATKLSHIFSGVAPSRLSQIFENHAAMAVNVKTAEEIGYKIPIDILSNSDEIFLDYKGTVVSSGQQIVVNDADDDSYNPIRTETGKKFKIAIVQSGEYWEFHKHLEGILKGLKTMEWLKESIFISEDENITTMELIDSLGDDYSTFVDFPKEMIINMNWDEQYLINNNLYPLLEEADLIIALGGMAGKAFTKTNAINKPVLLEAITDPIGSGIVYSVSDSGHDNITCRIDQTQYQRQIKLFHDFTGFKKLGIIYGDDEYGRLYGAVNDIELMAIKDGFEVVANTNVLERIDPATPTMYLNALRDLCTKVDAVYIGASTAVTEYDIMDEIRDILVEAKIPSFALEGEIRVKQGILLGVSSLETEKVGLYNAKKIILMLKGELPRLLSQNFVGVPSIAMNIETAKGIGIDYPLSTLAAIDKLY